MQREVFAVGDIIMIQVCGLDPHDGQKITLFGLRNPICLDTFNYCDMFT